MQQNELQHYGVPGMKWGVIRYKRKQSQNDKLRKKALEYDRKSASLTKKSEKAHAKLDLEGANRKATKAASLKAKSAKAAKKALKSTNEVERTLYERRSKKLNYKAAKTQIKANRMSKSTGYGAKAMKYSIKSDRVAAKAEKARLKIANNEAYIARMNRKISSLTQEELNGAYSFINELMRD